MACLSDRVATHKELGRVLQTVLGIESVQTHNNPDYKHVVVR